jgi:GR25 family glycosyltransferase involved in LPS biosynthesis
MLQGIALAIHTAAHVWKLRLASSDDRISDISLVELACYDRLSKAQLPWVSYPACKENLYACRQEAFLLLRAAMDHVIDCTMGTKASRTVDASLAMQLALIIIGDMNVLVETHEKAMNDLNDDNFWVPVACCSAFRQLQLRQMDAFRVKQGSLMVSSAPSHSVSDQLTSIFDSLLDPNKLSPGVVDMIVKCCMQLSDAEYIYKVLLWLAKCNISHTDCANFTATISQFLGSPFSDVRSPVVRVINLKRRHDRMKTFMAQAQSESILVSKAVARLDVNDEQCAQIASTVAAFDTKYIWGMHALDGQGGMVEVTSRLSKEIGESRKLSDFVETHWRPNDLKAFDKDARNDETLVQLSPSERACALSHIASWKGVYRSLSVCPLSQDKPLDGLPFPFTISGYARGKPLLHSNEHLPPTPVCVILEDDAIMVDRFADRLFALLEELPRDFQFCSIGYSRPKTAPIAKYSTHLGIPSCIWYMTGYILSLEGAKHLLESLPVQGPVDSWIGLKMCANWDNVFGQAMGVGARSSASAELPSRKDLARILKFRAFAALVPLCSQKVDTMTNTTVGQSWRQRDTDVTYSGNL